MIKKVETIRDVFSLQREAEGLAFVGVTQSKKYYTIDGNNCEELSLEKAAQTLRLTVDEFLKEVDKLFETKLTDEQLDQPLESKPEEVKKEQASIEEIKKEVEQIEEIKKEESSIEQLMESISSIKEAEPQVEEVKVSKEELIEAVEKLLDLIKKLA